MIFNVVLLVLAGACAGFGIATRDWRPHIATAAIVVILLILMLLLGAHAIPTLP